MTTPSPVTTPPVATRPRIPWRIVTRFFLLYAGISFVLTGFVRVLTPRPSDSNPIIGFLAGIVFALLSMFLIERRFKDALGEPRFGRKKYPGLVGLTYFVAFVIGSLLSAVVIAYVRTR